MSNGHVLMWGAGMITSVGVSFMQQLAHDGVLGYWPTFFATVFAAMVILVAASVAADHMDASKKP